MKVFNVVIVGAGRACLAIMDLLLVGSQRQLRMKLIGVADIDPEAPGVKRAKELNLYTTTDYHDLFSLKDLNLILELTGRDEISKSIQTEKPAQVQFMDHTVSRLFWDIIHLEEEKLIPESEANKQIKAVSRLFMDMIDLEEEKLTAEKEAEARITAERDNTARILDGLSEAVVVLNKNYNIESANETFIRDFGSDRETVIGKPCHEIIFDRSEPCENFFCPLVDLALDSQKSTRKEFEFRRNGHTQYYEANYNALKDDRGEYTRCLISMNDITHRKTLALDLEKSQKKYKNLFQDARDGIVLFNRQGKVMEGNLSLSHMLDYSRDELEHMNIADLAEKTSKKVLLDYLDDLEIMGFVSVEMDFVKKNKDPLPVELSLSWLPEETIFFRGWLEISPSGKNWRSLVNFIPTGLKKRLKREPKN